MSLVTGIEIANETNSWVYVSTKNHDYVTVIGEVSDASPGTLDTPFGFSYPPETTGHITIVMKNSAGDCVQLGFVGEKIMDSRTIYNDGSLSLKVRNQAVKVNGAEVAHGYLLEVSSN